MIVALQASNPETKPNSQSNDAAGQQGECDADRDNGGILRFRVHLFRGTHDPAHPEESRRKAFLRCALFS